MKKIIIFSFLSIFLFQPLWSQNNMDAIVSNYFKDLQKRSSFKEKDLSEWKISSVGTSLNPNIKHVYIQQYYNGIPIQGATYKLTVKNGKVTWHTSSFIHDIERKVVSRAPALTAEAAITKSARHHNLGQPQLENVKNPKAKISTFKAKNISKSTISAKPQYLLLEGKLHYTWNINFLEKSGDHYWNDHIDATTGEVLQSNDRIIRCSFGEPITSNRTRINLSLSNNIDESLEDPFGEDPEGSSLLGPSGDERYLVFQRPVESPDHGGQTIVTNPYDLTASPRGWHDTHNLSGFGGSSYINTRGNNVWAKEDSDGNDIGDDHVDGPGHSPSAADLFFLFPHNDNLMHTNLSNVNASIVNVFYWMNLAHDVSYHYGFDEANGNFQENNYGRGGVQGDHLFADILDRLIPTKQGVFYPTIDGEYPSVEFYNPEFNTIDIALDNLVSTHEYAHGISTRLVGGPNSIGFPSSGLEHMSEGWSDWFGLMMTLDGVTRNRAIGNYFLGVPPPGTNGIRPQPYSPDMAVNSFTYDDLGSPGFQEVHEVGFGWATILWDLTWALIDGIGYDPNIYTGTGGNNIAMALIFEGMKNTPEVNMGFVSGRDAILQADADLYNGSYECLIMDVFARRGVGVGAVEDTNGGTNALNDQDPSFDSGCPVPECTNPLLPPYSESFESSIGDWTQSTTDDLDWTRRSGDTPTAGTGPTSASNGSWYMYVEASGNTGNTAELESPCIDLTNSAAANFSFDYHMWGSDFPGNPSPNGEIVLQISVNNGLSWQNLWDNRGNQGNNWINVDLDITNFVGNVVRFRFVRNIGSSGSVDVAIDHINMEESDYCTINGFFNVIPNGYIDEVDLNFGALFNNHGFSPENYQDFTSMSTVLNDFNNILKVTRVYPFSSEFFANGTNNSTVFIDWNRDGDFLDPNENLITSSTIIQLVETTVFHIPNNAVSGPTRMRIFTYPDSSCGNPENNYKGEAEEYTVIIPTGFTGGTAPPGRPALTTINNSLSFSAVNNGFKLYPNPVNKGILNIERLNTDKAEYTIYNLLGQNVLSGELKSAINVSQLEKGVYIIDIKSNTETYRHRFIIN